MKRICIYVTYDKQNIVDAYIGYMLEEIKKNVDYLVVVCNETNVVKGLEYLTRYADEIFFRENIGYDAGAFKDALCNLIGWNEINQYDELFLINDSFFGPFVPFKVILNEMESRKVDFWGLMVHAEVNKKENVHILPHIQSYFIAIQEKMLHSDTFREYWSQMPYYTSFDDVVKMHEIKFSEYFSKKGYTYSGLAITSPNDSNNLANNHTQYMYLSFELIKKRKFPILKKQQLAYNNLDRQTQENYLRAIKYIEHNTNYDVNLIWDNIIRTLNISDLYRNLHLLYIISNDDIGKKYNCDDAVIMINVSNISAIEGVTNYLSPIESHIKIIVNPDFCSIAEEYLNRGYEVLKVDTDYNEIYSILMQYEYICLLNDEDLSSDNRPSYIGKSYFFNVWGNLLGERNHIKNVLRVFNEEKRLGVLLPPVSIFGIYFGSQRIKWKEKYNEIHKIIEAHNINCICSRDKAPFTVSKSLWIKRDVLRRAMELQVYHFSQLEYLWIYLAQDRGYYSGVVESSEYASMNEINKSYYIEDLLDQVSEQYGEVSAYIDMKKQIFSGAISKFCMKYEKIYVYGIGNMAREYLPYIPKVSGYVVSDGQCNPREFKSKKVYFLSEIPIDENSGIVICLDKRYQPEITAMLEKQNIKNYICI